MAQDKNYKRFVSALSVLDTLISGERPNSKPTKSDLELINKILKKENNAFGDYIQNLFEYYVIYAKRIIINFYWFNEYYKDLTGVLTKGDTEVMPLIADIVKYFPCCEYLGIENGHQGINADEKYLETLLSEVSKLDKNEGYELKQIELLDAKFTPQVVFGDFMEKYFNAGFDVNIEKKKYNKSLLFKAVVEET